MSRIDELIAEHCSGGVEYKTLGEIGYFYGGLTGKSKEDFKDGNAKFITYMNVFSNLEVNINMPDRVKIGVTERQNTVRFGDVLFTGSSETRDECGMTAVLTDKTNEPLYLNSFCFGFRLNDTSLLSPSFSKYLFRSETLRKQIIRTASGVTRFNVSKEKMKKVRIPLPPLPVQQEIVYLLDNFSKLTFELTETLNAELTTRKKQYEFYRDFLLTFDAPRERERRVAQWVRLSEVSIYSDSRIAASELNDCTYVGVDNLLPNKNGKTTSSYLPTTGNFTEYRSGDILIGNIRPYLKKIWLADNSGGTNGDVLVIRITDKNVIPRFFYYSLSSDKFFSYSMQHAKGAKMPRGSKDAVMRYQIPLPPLAEQARIVAILDKFYALTTDITAGLPAEITARQKQYEWYRDRLLRFEERS